MNIHVHVHALLQSKSQNTLPSTLKPFCMYLMKITLNETNFSKINSIFGTSEVHSFSHAMIFDM